MRKRNSSVIMTLLALAVFVFGITDDAEAVNADSCSKSDVQTAVQNAGRGGTVTVPAGSCTWNSTLKLTYGITLTGAGAGNTIITSSGGSRLIQVVPDATAIANSENIQITGFTFDGGNSADTLINIQGANGITGTKPYRYLLIGDNQFQNSSPSGSNGVIQADADSNGQIRGVIYHNVFDRCNIIIRPFSNDDTGEWSNTAFNQFIYGDEDNLYFEDNTIQYSSSYSGDNPGWIESGQGGRIVVRYNTWNLQHATQPQEVWDIHGFQNWNGQPDSGQTSTMIVEYYGNTLSNMGTYRWINHRGSWGVFFDNILTGSGDNEIDADQYADGCPNDISPSPSNYNPVINNTYVFNNTVNGTVSKMILGGEKGCGVAENANWWNYSASCTASSCSSGIGRGTTPPNGTCTTGVGYWVASTATPTADPAVIQNGQFYKCTSPNTWALYYTPYTYPHPLRTGQGDPPDPPTNLDAIVQ